jgi:hypothetical protein
MRHGARPKVILHSQNSLGRLEMGSLLEQMGFEDVNIFEMPFSQTYVRWLSSLTRA